MKIKSIKKIELSEPKQYYDVMSARVEQDIREMIDSLPNR